MRTILVAFFLLFAVPAIAQQTGGNANDRVAQQLGQFFMQLQVQQDQIAGLRAALEKEQAEVKRLKGKYEPEPAKPKE